MAGMGVVMSFVRTLRAPFWLAPDRRISHLLLAAAALLLAGCASEPKLTYDLNPVSGGFPARGAKGQIAIPVPEATLPANSTSIVVRTGPLSVEYLSGAQWAEKLPPLIQSRLIESFENAHVVRAAGKPGMLADATLPTNLRRFDFDPARGEAVVEISAQLVRPNGRIISERLFSAACPALSSESSAVAAALDAALGQVMREIVLWAAPKI
jgi:cholesterol transport system auxiliary component